MDLRSILTIVLLNGLDDKAFENLKAHMGTSSRRRSKYTRKLKGKKIKPEKKKKQKKVVARLDDQAVTRKGRHEPSFFVLWWVLGPGHSPPPPRGGGPSRAAGGGPAEPGGGVPGLGRLYRYSREEGLPPPPAPSGRVSPWVWA